MAGSDFIDISLAEVANTASSIRATNQRLKTNLGDIKTQMNSLSSLGAVRLPTTLLLALTR